MQCNSYLFLLIIEYQNHLVLKAKVLIDALISNLNPSTSISVHHQKKVTRTEPIPVNKWRLRGLENWDNVRQ